MAWKFPEFGKEYIVLVLLIGIIVLKIMKIDSYTDVALGGVLGWLFGVKMEQMRKK